MPKPRKNKSGRTFHFSIEDKPFYPHIKLTREIFPRLLSTRKVGDDEAEYFGPFLTRTSARILIDFLSRVFRLRSCTIEIDGKFPVPCTQYYSKRCVAPCVWSLCSQEKYLESVRLARLFLLDLRENFESEIGDMISSAAGSLNFERAAFLRDILQQVRVFWLDKRGHVWITNAVDTLILDDSGTKVSVFLLTTRGARMIGSRVFSFPAFPGVESTQALADVIEQFYLVNLPREIRVSRDFSDRRRLTQELSERFGRQVRIAVMRPESVSATAAKALIRTKINSDLDDLRIEKTPRESAVEIKKLFGLDKLPIRIEGLDAAHISGSVFVGAMSVWQDGTFRTGEYFSQISNATNEIDTIREFARLRLAKEDHALPDLILVDGARAHVNAVVEAAGELKNRKLAVIGAVKPRGKHSQISHFLLEDGRSIDFDAGNDAMRIVQRLRDDAHELANETHRTSRDMAYQYELAGVLPSISEYERQQLLAQFGSIKRILSLTKQELDGTFADKKITKTIADIDRNRKGMSITVVPLIVPIRYDDPLGDASDLRPINSLR